jgi:hypothetical protein
LFSVLLPGRPRKFEKASSGSHLHSGNKEILVFNSDQ